MKKLKLAILFYIGIFFVMVGLSCTQPVINVIFFLIGSGLLYIVCSMCTWDDLKKINGMYWIEKKTGIDFMSEEC
jgi:Kef-type K+ transport system membrane component KefB